MKFYCVINLLYSIVLLNTRMALLTILKIDNLFINIGLKLKTHLKCITDLCSERTTFKYAATRKKLK